MRSNTCFVNERLVVRPYLRLCLRPTQTTSAEKMSSPHTATTGGAKLKPAPPDARYPNQPARVTVSGHPEWKGVRGRGEECVAWYIRDRMRFSMTARLRLKKKLCNHLAFDPVRPTQLCQGVYCLYPFHDCLVGPVVKACSSRAEDPGFESRLRRDFSRDRVIPVT